MHFKTGKLHSFHSYVSYDVDKMLLISMKIYEVNKFLIFRITGIGLNVCQVGIVGQKPQTHVDSR